MRVAADDDVRVDAGEGGRNVVLGCDRREDLRVGRGRSVAEEHATEALDVRPDGRRPTSDALERLRAETCRGPTSDLRQRALLGRGDRLAIAVAAQEPHSLPLRLEPVEAFGG